MSRGTLWYIAEPLDTEFARADSRSPPQRITPSLCDRCSRGARYIKSKPLIFEWEAGADDIADFIWPDVTRVVVRKTVFEVLAREFRGIHAEPVEMVQDPKLKQPKRRTSRTKPRIWLPYSGPELVELWTDHEVPYLPETTTEIPWQCKKCGNEPRMLSGFERKSHLYDREKGILVPNHQPRVPGKGVFVAASEVKDSPIFRLQEFTGPILCTDEVKSFVERQGFTNIDFREYGDIV
jgi:hypothetical protein